MKRYFKHTLGLVLAVATFVSIGCSSTKAKNPAEEQNTGSSQTTTGTSQTTDQTAASTAGSETLEGCVFKRETEIYVQPLSGGPAKKVSSSGKDVSANEGQSVRLSGSTQSASQGGSQTSSTASGSTSGSSTGASGEPEFAVTRVDVVAKECPADVQSQIDQDKKKNK